MLMKGKSDEKIGLKIALKYGLLSPWTALVVVRKNGAGKTVEMPALRKVAQMAPAGWSMLRSASLGNVARPMALNASGMNSVSLSMAELAASGMTRICEPRGYAEIFGAFDSAPAMRDSDPSWFEAWAGEPGGEPSAFLKALELEVMAGRVPTTIEALVAIGLDEAAKKHLERIAEIHGEKQAVIAWIVRMLEGAAGRLSMMAGVMAAKLRQSLSAEVLAAA
jgi:hypothetical protein